LLLTFVLTARWIVRHSPAPHIDVFMMQKEAVAGLLRGVNPYELTFSNIYDAIGTAAFYAPSMVAGDRLNIGFHYPPLALLLAVPGELLAGDIRYSLVIALAIAGAGLTRMNPGTGGFMAAAFLLFSPRTFFVLEQGWTDCYAIGLLVMVVYCARRAPRALPVAIGLMLASKHYMVLIVPLLWLLPWGAPWSRRPWLTVGIVVLVAAMCTLPFVLWEPRAFWTSLVTVQFQLPFREDALTFPALIALLTGVRLPSAIGFIAATVATATALRCLARNAAGFAVAVALVCFSFFAFNRQAFCNYYFFVIGALCSALAACPADAGGVARPAAANNSAYVTGSQ
jgi:hypothetical protein